MDEAVAYPAPANDFDPLAFAEKWFLSQPERDLAAKKRQKELESAELSAQAENDAKITSSIAYPARALRRPSLVGAVYPTPPDGVQHPIGATPSFDGNVSTPGYPTQQSVPVDAEQIALTKDDTDDADIDTSDMAAGKPEMPTAALEFSDPASDNLFGDMDGDLFGETDITDADFSFFDEPDIFETGESKISTENPSADVKMEPPLSADTTDVDNMTKEPRGSSIERDVDMEFPPPDLKEEEVKEPDKPTLLVTQSPGIDTAPEIDIFTNKIVDPPPRRVSPPLSPEMVFKRVSTSGPFQEKSLGLGTSLFRGLKFDPLLSTFNSKYGAQGRFNSPTSTKSLLRTASIDLPKTGYLKTRRKRKSIATGFSPRPAELAARKNNGSFGGPDSGSDAESADDEAMSPMSDQDDTSNTTDDGLGALSPKAKRKRSANDEVDEGGNMTSSFQELQVNHSTPGSETDPLHHISPSMLDENPAEWSLARYLSRPEMQIFANAFSDAELVALAQTLADQAMSKTLHIPGLTDSGVLRQRSTPSKDSSRNADLVHKSLLSAAKTYFDAVKESTTAGFVDAQDAAAGQKNRLPPRPMPNPRPSQGSEPPKMGLFYPIPTPHLEVRRAEGKLSVLPSAIQFWDNLGLGPYIGPKDVSAVCVAPSGTGMTESVEAFLSHVGSAYESGRLGTHESLSEDMFRYDSKLTRSGLLSSASAEGQVFAALNEITEQLARTLANAKAEETNLVIYYVYDSSTPEILVHICAAFHKLFGVYQENLIAEKRVTSNEVVLQLVPLQFVASQSSLVIPAPSEYARLAMEVYDRCTDLKSAVSTPSIVIERLPPRMIDFKVTPNPSESLMHENSSMHVAYSQSIDGRWITAAWTNNTGTQQMTASYCLGRRGEPLRTTLAVVTEEIWETTLGIIAARKVHWKVMIARCGVMEASEIECWKTLAAQKTDAQVSLIMLSIDSNPSLQLLPPSISLPPSNLTSQFASYTTPVSTPQASSIVSPEQSGNATTPAREGATPNASTPNDSQVELKIEPDATLVDVTDQTWGAVLSPKQNATSSQPETGTILASGYLIKRSGTSSSDIPVVIEINLLHTEYNLRLHESLLREVLNLYRALGTLARARGCLDPAKDARPWHVAAAEKGSDILHMLM